MAATPLICTVRGCQAPLEREPKALACPHGHRFDVARRGQINLLQPQDRRALDAGDRAEVVAARQRLAAAGHDHTLIEAIARVLGSAWGQGPGSRRVLDIGCGEGSILRALNGAFPGTLETWGVDLSAPAIDAAAKASPATGWVVANADRLLPLADASCDAVLSITARLLPEESRRVLRDGGLLLVAVAGRDDLIELRQEILGQATERDRVERTVDLFGASFELVEHLEVRRPFAASPELLRDLAAVSYRAGRSQREQRLAALETGLEVTFARDLLIFRPRP